MQVECTLMPCLINAYCINIHLVISYNDTPTNLNYVVINNCLRILV